MTAAVGTLLVAGSVVVSTSPSHAAGVPCAGFTAIGAGQSHSVALGPGGTVYAWGDNFYGQLGDGTTTSRSTPVTVLGPGGTPLTGVTAVAAGQSHSLAVGPGGTVYAWGRNFIGQLGDGTTTNRRTAVLVLGPGGTPLTGITAVAGGGPHSLAVGPGGALYGWGANFDGQLGDGTTTNRSTAVPVLGPSGTPLTGVTAVDGGGNHSVALAAGGTVYAWGSNSSGQLGDGPTTDRTMAGPVTGGTLTGVAAVSAGGHHSLALSAGGTVYAWGSNSSGQLGDGTTVTRSTPGPVPGLSGVTVIAGGSSHSLALGLGGTGYAWGYNGDGQLGDGTTTSTSAPVRVFGLGGATAVAGGANHSLAVGAAGTGYAWGYNGQGRLGDGTTTDRSTPGAVVGCP